METANHFHLGPTVGTKNVEPLRRRITTLIVMLIHALVKPSGTQSAGLIGSAVRAALKMYT
jgi:hypothetical protein